MTLMQAAKNAGWVKCGICGGTNFYKYKKKGHPYLRIRKNGSKWTLGALSGTTIESLLPHL